jgi:magnesium transporter
MIKNTTHRQLLNAIKNKNIMKIRELSRSTSVSDIVDILKKMNLKNSLLFLRSLDTEQMADVFEKIEPENQALLIERFSDESSKKLFDELFVDEIADMIEELPDHIVTKILKNTSREKRKIINKILSYSDDETGSIMSVDIIKLKDSWTVKQALLYIKKYNEDREVVSHYYVTNEINELSGMVTIHDLAFSAKNKKLRNIME